MTDAESNNNNSNPNISNPYSGGEGAPPPLPVWADKLKRLVYLSISVFGLTKYFNFFKALLKSPHIRHFWFQIGLACTIATLMLKAYVEVYQGKIQKTKVNYQNFRHTTHTVMALIGVATLAFNTALWPHYGWNAPFILAIFFFGIILQFCLLVPTSVQNVVALIVLTFFLQEYSGYTQYV